MAEKLEVIINDSITLSADSIYWSYEQTDSEDSGATADNVMYREVLPERMKFGITKEHLTEEEAAVWLKVQRYESCSVNFWDLRENGRRTLTMYPASDEITAGYKINGEFYCESFELRFIQMIPT